MQNDEINRESGAATQDGHWFAAPVVPYRTFENLIDGAVITLKDIATARRLETGLREALAMHGGEDAEEDR